jgi:hypothetical protein
VPDIRTNLATVMHRVSEESTRSVNTVAEQGSLHAPYHPSVHGLRLSVPVDYIATTKAIPPPSGVSSFHTIGEYETPSWTFEAFPKLNRMRWFNSAKLAIAFCLLTTIMVLANVAYNILLAIHGNYQGYLDNFTFNFFFSTWAISGLSLDHHL